MGEIGVGTKVCCIWELDAQCGETVPTVGRIYTVRDIEPSHDPAFAELFIRLNEIINSPRLYENGFHECNFSIEAFRPIDDSAIDIFREIARTAPHDELEGV